VRKPNQIPMVGVGIFPAAQYGLNFSSDENREVRVFTGSGNALALSHPAYLGASVKSEPLVHDMLEGDEVSMRQEWKSAAGVRMIGVASRIPDSNLFVAIETKAAQGAKLAAWTYLILCALGAGIINWVLFHSIFRSVLSQLSTAEEQNETLRRQMSEAPPRSAPAIVPDVSKGDPVIPLSELGAVDFIDAIANAPLVRTADAPALPESAPAAEGESGKAAFEKVVSAAIRSLDKRISENQISVMRFGLEDLMIDGDALQLQTAIEEILKNAIEAMQTSTTKNLTVSGRKMPNAMRVTIEDTGVGVPDGNIEKVFDPFFSTKDSEGVARGLGLNVARRVVEELNGSVKLHSRPDAGTRVEIEFPLQDAATEAEPPVEITLESEEDFAIAELPSLPVQEREYLEVPIRKPKVRTLD
jgi:anti-sigma regulatory factor (Ser/Thr protein kinase)